MFCGATRAVIAGKFADTKIPILDVRAATMTRTTCRGTSMALVRSALNDKLLTGDDAAAFALMDLCKFPSIYTPMSSVRAVIPISDLAKAAEIADVVLDESLLDTIARGESYIRKQDIDREKQKTEDAERNAGRR